MGLPTLTVIFADNQSQTTQDVAETGAISYLGWASNLSSADYAHAIRRLLDQPDVLIFTSTKALALIDPSIDGAKSVIGAMNDITNTWKC